MKRFCLVLALILALPCVSRAADGFSLLALGPGSWSGTTRLLTATVANGAIRRVATVGIGSLATAGLMTAVVIAEAMLEPMASTAVDEIRTWMAGAGIAVNSVGVVSQATVVDGSSVESCNIQVQGWLVPGTQSITHLFTGSGSAYDACMYNCREEVCQRIPKYTGVGQWTTTSAPPHPNYSGTFYLCTGSSPNVGARCNCSWPISSPCTGTNTTVPGPFVPTTPEAVRNKAQADLDNAVPAAKSAAEAAEDVVRKGLRGESVPIGAAAVPGQKVIDKPVAAPGGGTTTPRDTATNNVRTNLPADTATATNDPAATGTQTAEVETAKEYVNPAYSGTFTLPEWPEVDSLGSRMTSFLSAMGSTGLFAVAGGLGSPGTGGTSTASIQTDYFGTINFDFADLGAGFAIIRAMVMILCAWVAIKIVCISGGN